MALSLGHRHAEAIEEFEKAMALEPNSFEVAYLYARASFTRGDLVQAGKLFQLATEIKPDDYQSPLLLIAVHRALGRPDELMEAARVGIKRAEQELARHPEDPRPAYLGAVALVILGDADRAKEWASRALAIDPDDLLTQYNLACFYAQLGDMEQALSLLERLLPQANRETVEWLKHDSDLDPIRSHPRFQNVLKTIG